MEIYNVIKLIETNNKKEFKEYVDKNKHSINKKYKNGNTLLIIAINNIIEHDYDCDILEILLDNNADINIQNNLGETALIYISMHSKTKNQLNALQILIERGANLEIEDNYESTALMSACLNSKNNSCPDAVRLLIEGGANINHITKDGSSIFGCSLCESYPNGGECSQDVLKMLINNGADINIEADDGITPLILSAMLSNHYELNTLINNGVNINYINKDGNTALIMACKKIKYDDKNYQKDTVKLLLKHNANIDIKNNKGYNAIYYAKKYYSIKITSLLYERKLENQKKELENYYENLIQQKLQEQKEKLLEEIYAPDGIGYKAAKDRFEK